MKKNATWTQLSKDIGFATQTVRDWRKLPGSPKTPDADKWREFIEENQLGVAGNRVSRDREYWLTKKAEKDVALLEIKIRKEEGSAIGIEEHDDYVGRLGQSIRSSLLTLENVVPRLAGKSQAEMRIEIRKEVDRFIAMFRKTMNEWKPAQGDN